MRKLFGIAAAMAATPIANRSGEVPGAISSGDDMTAPGHAAHGRQGGTCADVSGS
ncbi:MAG TPA: hypothetical protein VFO41_17960 [Alphaproteobacteria bacterium]|nr:hypothetical protein [Alphaproteobacteria bacterium]